MNGLIPRQFIDELLTKIDIVDLIDSYVPLKKRGQNHLACCPFHQEKSPSFNVTPKKQFYHCFGCGASGNAISFIMAYLHQSFPQAIETLATKLGLSIPREDRPERVKQRVSLHPLLQKVTDYYQQTLRSSSAAVAVTYLKQRGVSGHIAKQYQIGYAPNGWHTLEQQFSKNRAELLITGMLVEKDDGNHYDRYRHRIVFPIHDRHGRIIGFGGRAIDADQQPKYLNSPETPLFQKSRELYGLYQAIQQQPKHPSIIIVEGYLDVIALAQHGVSNVVATLGTATTPYHIQLLSKYTSHLIFCFDGDKAGRQAAWRALESSVPHLDGGLSASFAFLPEGQDPDSFIRAQGQSGFEAQLDRALSWHQFFFDTLLGDTPHTDLAGKSQLIHAAKPYLSKMNGGPYKTLLIEELARLTRIESHRIETLLLEQTQNPSTPPSPTQSETLSRTPLHIALALLIQHPDIIHQQIRTMTLPIELEDEYIVLSSLLHHLNEYPMNHTATLIEHYRETPWFEALTQLATWAHQVPEHAIASEWIATLQFIHKKSQENQIRHLIDKSKQGILTESERYTLQHMLQARHPTIHPSS